LEDAPAAQQAGSGNSRRRALVLASVGVVVLAAVTVAIVAVTSSVWPRVVMVVPCTEQHVAEVFFAGNVWPQSLAYPGDNEVSRQANDRCDTALDAYAGRPDHLVTFTDRATYPGNTVWSSGDRLVLCVAYKASFQSVDYSIKGSNR
jgi:Septum formation